MFFLHLFTENYTKNMKQKHIILLFISMTLIVFYLITNSWGEPESKLIKSKDKISIGKGFESISGTLWENNTQDLSSSEIGFYIEGLKDTKGYFEDFNVVLKVPKNKPENAKIKVSIKVSSINTDNSTRDKALMDEEFFNENKLIGYSLNQYQNVACDPIENGFIEVCMLACLLTVLAYFIWYVFKCLRYIFRLGFKQ